MEYKFSADLRKSGKDFQKTIEQPVKRAERPRELEYRDSSDHAESMPRSKEYQHWKSRAEQEDNRKKVRDYDYKKCSVDQASVATQRSVLTKYGAYFDSENIARLKSEIGSNKLEIYNEPYFATEMAYDQWPMVTRGMRNMADGRICIRDSDNIPRLVHTATHETMHDLSYQHKDHSTQTVRETGEGLRTSSETELRSGIHKVSRQEIITNGNAIDLKVEHSNQYLNEGLTELYTIEEMQERGENPDFDSYSQEVGWALLLKEKLGDDVVAAAYFGGDVGSLQEKFNGMSAVPDAWSEFNRNIDMYGTTGDLRYKNIADSIIDGLESGPTLARRRF